MACAEREKLDMLMDWLAFANLRRHVSLILKYKINSTISRMVEKHILYGSNERHGTNKPSSKLEQLETTSAQHSTAIFLRSLNFVSSRSEKVFVCVRYNCEFNGF